MGGMRSRALLGSICLLCVAVGLFLMRRPNGRETRAAIESDAVSPLRPLETRLTREIAERDPLLEAAGVLAAPPSLRTEVLVTTVEGVGIPGASIVQLPECSALGVTAAEGGLTLPTRQLSGRVLSVSAEGFVPTTVSAPAQPGPRVEVCLRAGWSIHGLVLDPTGVPLSGLRVVGVDPTRFLGAEAVRRTVSGIPELRTAMTDELGRFQLCGLDSSLAYKILVGGRGYFSFEPFAEPVLPSEEAYVEITAERLFGIKIVCRRGDGTPPRLGPSLSGAWRGQVRSSVPDARQALAGEWTGELLGIADGRAESPYDVVAYFCSRMDRSSVPFWFTASLPGYAPIDLELEARRAVDHLEDHRLTLEVTVDEVGSVAVLAAPSSLVDEVLPSAGPGGGCRLTLVDPSRGTTIDCALDPIVAGLHVIEGVPLGRYEAVFRAPHQLMRYPEFGQPPLLLEVAGSPAEFSLPLEHWGSIGFDINDPRGLSYAGALRGTLTRTRGEESDEFHFEGRPYVLPLLPEGEYRLELHGLDLEGEDERTLDVVAGKRSEALFRLAP